jgi:hypothetical protein
MEHTDSFNYRLLLVAQDMTSAESINYYFKKAGLAEMDVETGITNVIPKLRNSVYEGCVMEATDRMDITKLITRIRATNYGAQIPIIVVAPTLTWMACKLLYEAGANFVINTNLNEDTANNVCWMLSSLVTFVSAFKVISERFFR